MKRLVICLALSSALVMSGCGKRGDLKRTADMPPQAVPYGAKSPLTPAQQVRPTVQADPRRANEILTKSEPRGDDPFDLPPGSDYVAFPGDEKANERGAKSSDVSAQPTHP